MPDNRPTAADPAFPMPYTRENSGPAGLTKREYAAIQIMAGMAGFTVERMAGASAARSMPLQDADEILASMRRVPADTATLAVQLTDALLEALK